LDKIGDKMRTLKDIYDAMIHGDSYTNSEAIALRDHMQLVAKATLQLGPVFHLAHKEANEKFWLLSDVCQARGIDK